MMLKSKQKIKRKQLEAFKQTARELECDESIDALERVFQSVDPKKNKESKEDEGGGNRT